MKLTDVALMALQVVAPVLMAALTWAAAKLAALIRSKVDNEYLRGALVRLDDAVFTAVKELQQTVVAEVKAASADGKGCGSIRAAGVTKATVQVHQLHVPPCRSIRRGGEHEAGQRSCGS